MAKKKAERWNGRGPVRPPCEPSCPMGNAPGRRISLRHAQKLLVGLWNVAGLGVTEAAIVSTARPLFAGHVLVPAHVAAA